MRETQTKMCLRGIGRHRDCALTHHTLIVQFGKSEGFGKTRSCRCEILDFQCL